MPGENLRPLIGCRGCGFSALIFRCYAARIKDFGRDATPKLVIGSMTTWRATLGERFYPLGKFPQSSQILPDRVERLKKRLSDNSLEFSTLNRIDACKSACH